jgi:hypothetical protein
MLENFFLSLQVISLVFLRPSPILGNPYFQHPFPHYLIERKSPFSFYHSLGVRSMEVKQCLQWPRRRNLDGGSRWCHNKDKVTFILCYLLFI